MAQRFRKRIALALLFFAAALLGSDNPLPSGSVSGPVLGVVFDQVNGGLRPILGIPGASTIGDMLDVRGKILRAWVSPEQDFALAQITGNDGLMIVHFAEDPVFVQPLIDAAQGIDAVALSPTGQAACLYYPVSRRLQMVTGLPHMPRVVAEADLSWLSGSPGVMAISDDGGAAIVSDQAAGLVQIITIRDSSFVPIGRPSAISFLKNSRDALVVDRSRNELLLIADVAGKAERSTLAGEQDGIRGPVAVQVSDDGRRVLIANSLSSTISVLDLSSGMMTDVPCDCVPSGLFRLRGNSLFRLSELSETPVLVLDGSVGSPRILFIPQRSNEASAGRRPAVHRPGEEGAVGIRREDATRARH